MMSQICLAWKMVVCGRKEIEKKKKKYPDDFLVEISTNVERKVETGFIYFFMICKKNLVRFSFASIFYTQSSYTHANLKQSSMSVPHNFIFVLRFVPIVILSVWPPEQTFIYFNSQVRPS